MKNRNKFFLTGLLVIIISLLFINGFIQTNLSTVLNGSHLELKDPVTTIGSTATNYTILYGDPQDLTVTKSESITIDLYPNGSIKNQRATVNFVFENNAEENCSFDLIDRAEYCDLDTLRFQKGTFSDILDYEVISTDEEFGVTILQWSNISVNAKSRAEYGYSMVNYKLVPLKIETEYYVNETLIEIDANKNEINTSIGSRVSSIIRVKNMQQDLFSTSNTQKPITICLVTLMLPYEEEEEDRDFDIPLYDPAPITTNIIGPIQQVSWLALGDIYEINWTTTIRGGAGWGILEIQPLRVDIIQSASITNLLFDGLSGLLGLLAAQQLYWAGLNLMALVEELTGMIGVYQTFINDIQVLLGMLTMANYSLLNSLLISLIEIDMMRSSITEMHTELNSTYYTTIINDYNPWEDIRSTFRTILGINELPLYLEGTLSNDALGLGTPYMSIPLLLDYYDDIERRIIASFGAQLIELLGSPAIINMSSSTDDFSLLINASIIRNLDNTTDFYTLIDIANLTINLLEVGPYPILTLNLSRHYEFELNDVPGNRGLFIALDNFFGHPTIPSEFFPIGYHPTASPGSDFPGFYTWALDLLQVGRSALWWTIGNLTRSVATMLLQLDSSFSNETLILINAILTGSSNLNLTTPITLETGFSGLSNLMGIFSGVENQFRSPFGSPFSDLLPDLSSLNIPIGGEGLDLLENFGFWTALKIYLEPVPRIRHLLNITIPLNLENMTGNMNGMTGGIGFDKSAENGYMSNWNWSNHGLSTPILNQTNVSEGSIRFKQFQLKAAGDINNGYLLLERDFNYTIPASQIIYRLRINNTNPLISIIVVSQNASGADVYAIKQHLLSDFSTGTWYEFNYNLKSSDYWNYYDKSFDPEKIKKVQIKIIPKTLSPIKIDLDYLNLSRNILPYPYDLVILDNYLIGDGLEILPNLSIQEKWTSGLSITSLQTAEMTSDGINDIIAGSNDGHIYLLNGSNGDQIWNFSAKGEVINIFLEDITGDLTPEIIFGTSKGNIYTLNKTNNLLCGFSTGSNIDYLINGNLNGNGLDELIIVHGTNISTFDYSGNLIWNCTVKGTIRSILSEDINGDDIDEIALVTSKYKVYLLNGTNGNIIWNHTTEERPTHLITGNLKGDSKKELLYGTDQNFCVILNGTNGNQLQNFTTDSTILGIYTVNLTGDNYDDILLHTGTVIANNVSAIDCGDSLKLLWNFTPNVSFSSISTLDYSNQYKFDEILITAISNQVYLLNSTGDLWLNFTVPRSISKVSISELTQEGMKEFIFGLSNNIVLLLNGTNQKKLWMIELGEEIVTFQFIRTNETIQLLYNLPGPLTDLMDLTGFSVSGIGNLVNLNQLDLSLGIDSLGGIGSVIGGFNLGTINITLDNIQIKGLGLLNMLEFEISLIAQLQDIKQVSGTQRAFTGIHEVRYTEKDTIDYQLFPIISDEANTKYIQYKIRNYEEQPIMVHSFALNMTLAGQPLPLQRIIIEGWNGTHFVNLGNNAIRNITLAQLGLSYMDGKLIFRPYLEVEELEKTLLTIDWLGRELRIKIDTSSIDPNDLSIEPWIDVSIKLAGITIPGINSLISYSKVHPTFIVTSIPTPNIPENGVTESFIVLLLKSPVFWAFSIAALVTFLSFEYMRQREHREVKTIAAKKIMKWMKKREKSWKTLVKANIMTESQYFELKRIRYRLGKENLTKGTLETYADKVLNHKWINIFITTVLLKRFWRGVNRKSRLILILNNIEHMVLDPLRHAWATFKTALSHVNPWNMAHQRKKELQKKAGKKIFWKKIEPPRKPIRKKKIKSTLASEQPPKMEATESKKKIKKGWNGKYRNDGGILIKKIDQAKKLPSRTSRNGQIFYNLSKRKFVGMTLKELSKALELPEYEVLVSLIRLFEKGLVFLLQEGKTLRDDLWDISSSLRKYDSELEKMIDSIETLEGELTEGMEFLKADLKNEKNQPKENHSIENDID